MVWLMLLFIIVFLPRCVSVRMSDKKVAAYFADQPLKPSFAYTALRSDAPSVPVLHYARIGADTIPIVLFIHGSPGAWDAFIGFFKDTSLYHRAQLISVDRPGFGKSGLGRPERSLKVQAAAIAPLLDLNRTDPKPILVGHSLGGPVAARLAMDYPDKVGGLVLGAPSIDPALEKKEWYRHVGNVFPFRQILPVEFDVSNREILPLKGELEQMMPLWATIRVPVTVIQGEADPLVPPGNAAFAKRVLTQAPVTVRMIPRMNHFIPWSRPDLIRDAILEQLSNNQNISQLSK